MFCFHFACPYFHLFHTQIKLHGWEHSDTCFTEDQIESQTVLYLISFLQAAAWVSLLVSLFSVISLLDTNFKSPPRQARQISDLKWNMYYIFSSCPIYFSVFFYQITKCLSLIVNEPPSFFTLCSLPLSWFFIEWICPHTLSDYCFTPRNDTIFLWIQITTPRIISIHLA